MNSSRFSIELTGLEIIEETLAIDVNALGTRGEERFADRVVVENDPGDLLVRAVARALCRASTQLRALSTITQEDQESLSSDLNRYQAEARALRAAVGRLQAERDALLSERDHQPVGFLANKAEEMHYRQALTEIKEFNGTRTIEAVEAFLRPVKTICDYGPEATAVLLRSLGNKFVDKAALWWPNLTADERPSNYNELDTLLRSRFLPVESKITIDKQFYYAKQGTSEKIEAHHPDHETYDIETLYKVTRSFDMTLRIGHTPPSGTQRLEKMEIDTTRKNEICLFCDRAGHLVADCHSLRRYKKETGRKEDSYKDTNRPQRK
ncbi:hypothetical protein HK405_010981 [Cladochytrium tenue]|nr:hypothetical protein HK405_010981 [Cladochytrium tenue]